MDKDILEAIDSRIKSPIFGYFVISLLAVNWEVFFYLLVHSGDAASRIQYFHDNTDSSSLIYVPLLVTLIYSIAYPWVTYIFTYISSKPNELKNLLQLQSEYKLHSMRRDLEQLRNSMLSTVETELIGRARRDEELAKIEDETIRNKLKSEIEQLRKEKDELNSQPKTPKPDYGAYKELMGLADDLRARARNTTNITDRDLFIEQAREMEKRAAKIVRTEAETTN